jgi:hypothetical protein
MDEQMERMAELGDVIGILWETNPEIIIFGAGVLGVGLLGLTAGLWWLWKARSNAKAAQRHAEQVAVTLEKLTKYQTERSRAAKPYGSREEFWADVKNPAITTDAIFDRCAAEGSKWRVEKKPEAKVGGGSGLVWSAGGGDVYMGDWSGLVKSDPSVDWSPGSSFTITGGSGAGHTNG